MKSPKPTDDDVADAIRRIEGAPEDTSEVPGSRWKDTSPVVPWSEWRGLAGCGCLVLLGGCIGAIAGAVGGEQLAPMLGLERSMTSGLLPGPGFLLGGLGGGVLGAVLGGVLGARAGSRNVEAAEPKLSGGEEARPEEPPAAAENLEGADLADADMQGVNLRESNLKKANLQGANLQGADLRNANLTGADLKGANLQGADLNFADFSKANIEGADLRGAEGWRSFFSGAVGKAAHLPGDPLDQSTKNPRLNDPPPP